MRFVSGSFSLEAGDRDVLEFWLQKIILPPDSD